MVRSERFEMGGVVGGMGCGIDVAGCGLLKERRGRPNLIQRQAHVPNSLSRETLSIRKEENSVSSKLVCLLRPE